VLLAGEGWDPVAALAERGRWVRFIRRSTRSMARAPSIPPEEIRSPVPDLALPRTPCYAQKP